MSLSGDRIRNCRTLHHLTLDDVARHLGIGRQAVYKYEQGTVTNIPLVNIEKMAILFETTPCYLAGWDSNNSAPDPAVILKEDEYHLVTSYRDAEEPIRRAALKMLEDSAENNRPKKGTGSDRTA